MDRAAMKVNVMDSLNDLTSTLDLSTRTDRDKDGKEKEDFASRLLKLKNMVEHG